MRNEFCCFTNLHLLDPDPHSECGSRKPIECGSNANPGPKHCNLFWNKKKLIKGLGPNFSFDFNCHEIEHQVWSRSSIVWRIWLHKNYTALASQHIGVKAGARAVATLLERAVRVTSLYGSGDVTLIFFNDLFWLGSGSELSLISGSGFKSIRDE
jgi:hypothetical protein